MIRLNDEVSIEDGDVFVLTCIHNGEFPKGDQLKGFVGSSILTSSIKHCLTLLKAAIGLVTEHDDGYIGCLFKMENLGRLKDTFCFNYHDLFRTDVDGRRPAPTQNRSLSLYNSTTEMIKGNHTFMFTATVVTSASRKTQFEYYVEDLFAAVRKPLTTVLGLSEMSDGGLDEQSGLHNRSRTLLIIPAVMWFSLGIVLCIRGICLWRKDNRRHEEHNV